MASDISESHINSSAEWDLEDSPGPILREGMPCINAMSEVVGEMKGVLPNAKAAFTRG